MINAKIIIITILLGFLNRTLAQDTINWSSHYKLKWEDFKGVPDSLNKNDALNSIQIRYKLIPSDTGYSYFVYCFFSKPTAWTKVHKNDWLLNHEQRHFDIAEIFSRKLRQQFKNYKSNSISNIKSDFKIIFNRVAAEWDLFDKQYDIETKHSKDKTKQRQWDKKIDSELYSLRKFFK